MERSISKPLGDLQDDIDRQMQGYRSVPQPPGHGKLVSDAILSCTPGVVNPPPGFPRMPVGQHPPARPEDLMRDFASDIAERLENLSSDLQRTMKRQLSDEIGELQLTLRREMDMKLDMLMDE